MLLPLFYPSVAKEVIIIFSPFTENATLAYSISDQAILT